MSGTTTSPAATFATTAFSDAERADIRRFCGYQPYGPGNSGFIGFRFFQAYGVLEYKMTNMRPEEFQNVRYRLSLLYPIETAVSAAYATLNVDVAAAFTRNKNEVADRKRHFDSERRALCNVVGVPPGPDLDGPGMSMIV